MTYHEERINNLQRINELCLEMLNQLGSCQNQLGYWQEVRQVDVYENEGEQFITGLKDETGASLYFRVPYNKPEKVTINGSWPHIADRSFSPYRDQVPTCTGSFNKGYPKLAKDFIKRFLPAYLKIYAQQQKEANSYAADILARDKIAADLATLLQTTPKLSQNNVNRLFKNETEYTATVDINAADYIIFDITVRNLDLAKKLAAFLVGNI